jgi:thymidylate synthase (FAD)
MNYPINDPYFRVEVLSKTERPNLLSYLAMHQDYSEENVADELDKLSQLSESELGDRLVKKCLKFGHFGILEHPSITLNVIGFPHSVMVQARTHRVGISFDCQSQRYTSERFLKLAEDLDNYEEEYTKDGDYLRPFDLIEQVFYFRALGSYYDRVGNKYDYDMFSREKDILATENNLQEYRQNIVNRGFSPEHARDFLFQNFRQDFVVTFNARSLLHFCDLRLPKDSQLEIRTMAEMLFEKFSEWMPEVAEFYEKNRKGKNKLSP